MPRNKSSKKENKLNIIDDSDKERNKKKHTKKSHAIKDEELKDKPKDKDRSASSENTSKKENHKGKFFQYKSKTKEYERTRDKKSNKKRPNNQSDKPVQEKVANRLKKLIKENEGLKLTKLQKEYVKEVTKKAEDPRKTKKAPLKKMGIDMAHHVSCEVMMNAVLDRLNNPLPEDEKDNDAYNFVDSIISTDREASKEDLDSYFDSFQKKELSPKEKIKNADKLVIRLNKASKNLLPGYSATNKAIHESLDPHYVSSKDGDFERSPISKNLNASFNKFDKKNYGPITKKKFDEEEIFVQSSSIHSAPDKAWISIGKHKNFVTKIIEGIKGRLNKDKNKKIEVDDVLEITVVPKDISDFTPVKKITVKSTFKSPDVGDDEHNSEVEDSNNSSEMSVRELTFSQELSPKKNKNSDFFNSSRNPSNNEDETTEKKTEETKKSLTTKKLGGKN